VKTEQEHRSVHERRWAMCALGVWMIVSPWIVGDGPDAGVVWNNIIIGALALILGLVCAGTAAKSVPRP
jgi:hypothetical protein